MLQAMTALSVEHVLFAYRRGAPVLTDFAHAFEPGATLLLGPNGAGKSTLLALAATVLRPQKGTISLGDTVAAGRSLRTYRRRVSWMPQRVQAIPGLTVREQVAYAGWLKGMSRTAAWHEAARALDRVGLGSYGTRRPSHLSGGELRRVGVAQTLVHDAAFVLMDEPTAGLDPAQRAEFQCVMVAVGADASAVVSTHQTEDIDLSYDHVLVLNAGAVRFSGTTADFLALGGDTADPRERVVRAYGQALELEPAGR